ncbi:TOBE domain-containing protein [Afifella pfennigii]|uniref:TOBE domain-containing protein n=1 Tax=Afifella pfennigii TaxID=209897 RepID=UPI00047A68C6|nr:TOBE domain-containing protein [Afifella pfennigii]
MAVALWLFGDVRDAFACMETTRAAEGHLLDAPATMMWRHQDPPLHDVWDVSLALKMRVRTDYYASHEQFEIQGEEGLITVHRCSDRILDEPMLTLYRDGEVRAFHNIEDDWGASFAHSTRHFVDVSPLRRQGRRLPVTAGEGWIDGKVMVSEHLGSETYLHIRLAGDLDASIRASGVTTSSPGDRLGIAFETAECHVFREDGSALRRLSVPAILPDSDGKQTRPAEPQRAAAS